MPATTVTPDLAVQSAVAALDAEFPAAGHERVTQAVEAAMQRLAQNARVTTYVPLLAQRHAREHLRATLQREPEPAYAAVMLGRRSEH